MANKHFQEPYFRPETRWIASPWYKSLFEDALAARWPFVIFCR